MTRGGSTVKPNSFQVPFELDKVVQKGRGGGRKERERVELKSEEK